VLISATLVLMSTQIYLEIEKPARALRTEEEMKAEADFLRRAFEEQAVIDKGLFWCCFHLVSSTNVVCLKVCSMLLLSLRLM